MLSLTNLFLVAVGFLGMEAVTYLVHRFVMHGALRKLHRSHHRNAAAAFAKKTPEPNDVFPLAFSVVVIAGISIGFNMSGAAWLLPVLVGVSVYGVVYTVIHDGIIHGRIRWMKRVRSNWTTSLDEAHREHHRTNGEPYGMLLPSLSMRRTVKPTDSGHPTNPSTRTA